MLERASTCIENGARLSLRCAQQTASNKRQLHSAFFTHGALDVDLSALALDSIFGKGSEAIPHSVEKRRTTTSADSKVDKVECQEPGFLDFLYPRQALAWLRQRKTPPPHEPWEVRNAQRLPKGYVHASRRYSSIAHQRYIPNTLSKSDNAPRHEFEFPVGDWQEGRDLDDNPAETLSLETDQDERTSVEADQDEASSMQEEYQWSSEEFIAKTIESLSSQYSGPAKLTIEFIRSAEKRLKRRLESEDIEAYSSAVVDLYNKCSEMEQQSENFTVEVMGFLAKRHSDEADNNLMHIYNKLEPSHRTRRVRMIIIPAFMRCRLVGLANQTFLEAPHATHPAFNAWFIAQALRHDLWPVAYQAYSRAVHILPPRLAGVLWPRALGMAKGLPHARRLARSMYRDKTVSREDVVRWKHYVSFIKSAILQDLKRNNIYRTVEGKFRIETHRSIYRTILLDSDEESNAFFESIFRSIVQPSSNIDFNSAAQVTTFLIQRWLLHSQQINPQKRSHLLWQYLLRVMEYTEQFDGLHLSVHDVALERQNLNGGALVETEVMALMRYFARYGDQAHLSIWASKYRELWPSKEMDVRAVEIEVFASRRITANDFLASPRKSWFAVQLERQPVEATLLYKNAVLKAHVNAGKPFKAYEFLQRRLAGGIPVDAATFEPLLDYLASNGAQTAIERLLWTYEQHTGFPAPMKLLNKIIKAQVANHNLDAARTTFARYLYPRRNEDDDDGSLSESFNDLLMAAATHWGLREAVAIWQSMKAAGVRMDTYTYAAMMQAHVTNRHPETAVEILKVIMPRNNLQPSALHFGIAMQGRLNVGMPKAALELYDTCKSLKLRSSPLLEKLRFLALEELHGADLDVRPVFTGLSSMFKEWYGPVEPSYRMLYPSPHDRIGGGSLDNTIGALIALLGRLGQGEKIEKITKSHKRWRRNVNKVTIEILTGLMEANLVIGDFEAVHALWSTVLWRRRLKRKNELSDLSFMESEGEEDIESGVPSALAVEETAFSRGTWPAPLESMMRVPLAEPPSISMKDRIRSRAFGFEITAWAQQNEIQPLVSTINHYRSLGETMDRATINLAVQQLLTTSPPITSFAFELTEQYMIDGFQGWQVTDGFYETNARIRDGGLLMRQDSVDRLTLRPTYTTLAMLKHAWFRFCYIHEHQAWDIHRGVTSRVTRIGNLARLRHNAPKTLKVLHEMPFIPGEALQEQFFRPFVGKIAPSLRQLLDDKEWHTARRSRWAYRMLRRSIRRYNEAVGDTEYLLLRDPDDEQEIYFDPHVDNTLEEDNQLQEDNQLEEHDRLEEGNGLENGDDLEKDIDLDGISLEEDIDQEEDDDEAKAN